MAYFKYGRFLMDNFTVFLHFAGISFKPRPMDIILPIGISFYTFQTLSYTFDVYRGRIKPWPSLLDYTLFVTFFPHLVAGPIMRAEDLLPQFEKPKKATANQIGWGLVLLVVGLFTKMVMADAIFSGIAAKLYDSAQRPGFSGAWAGTFAFAMQIFCDFSGYSTCAIGTALALGFEFPDNFRFPYAAVGFSDFWRCWHITLSNWLRDYIYIPFGGNRKGSIRTYANILMTMLLGGLWHGASWMFVIWGGLHGFFLATERWIRQRRFTAYPFWKKGITQFFLTCGTFLCVCLTWVFFRAPNLGRARVILAAMLGRHGLTPRWIGLTPSMEYGVFGLTIAILFLHFKLKNRSFREVFENIPWWFQGSLVGVMIFGILLSIAKDDRAFIYFQF
ncbi:MAG: hypothetical protein AUJ71_00305 [Candidatus Omnitrophica bacterium CG1_02_49_16]|nr:MAG: hypothetical protein AUJ71_00305 [Candidatus Omnitrophica bacterium CG1_02_49_16]